MSSLQADWPSTCKIQRTDLLPRPDSSHNADERLDAWLERLPASRSSAPELEVTPGRWSCGRDRGGTVRDPSDHQCRLPAVAIQATRRKKEKMSIQFRLTPQDHSFLTVDQTDLPVEIDLPEDLDY